MFLPLFVLLPQLGIGLIPGGGEVLPITGPYGEASPERGTFFRLQVYERKGILLVEVYKRVGNLSFGSVKGPKGPNR